MAKVILPRAAFMPERVDNFEDLDMCFQLVDYYFKLGVRRLYVPTSLGGGGINHAQRAQLVAFVEGCRQKYPSLGLVPEWLKLWKSVITNERRLWAAQYLKMPGKQLQQLTVALRRPGEWIFTASDAQCLRRYRLIVKTTARGRLRVWRNMEPQAKFLDLQEDDALWEQQRAGSGDSYYFPLMVLRPGAHTILLSAPGEAVALVESLPPPEEIRNYEDDGYYWLGSVGLFGSGRRSLPFQVCGERMDFDLPETWELIAAHYEYCREIFRPYFNVVEWFGHGDELHWGLERGEVRAVFEKLERICKQRHSWFGDVVCGHNSNFRQGNYYNVPSDEDKLPWPALRLVVWGAKNNIREQAARAYEFGCRDLRLMLAASSPEVALDLCREQGIGYANLSSAQKRAVTQVVQYSESFEQAYRAGEMFQEFDKAANTKTLKR